VTQAQLAAGNARPAGEFDVVRREPAALPWPRASSWSWAMPRHIESHLATYLRSRHVDDLRADVMSILESYQDVIFS